MTNARTQREATLAKVRDTVKAVFAAHQEYRSALFSVAQYWNDQADDETHTNIVVSTRAVPLWPHTCRWDDYDDDGNPIASDHAEACSSCCYDLLRSPYIGVAEWEPYCHEHGSQEDSISEAYLPYALVRRRDDGEVDLEVVGKLQRPYNELVHGEPTRAVALDPRTRALFEEVYATPDDDAPRIVLSDHLLETDPRGEYIALALAAGLDDAGRARRDALLAAHERAWLQPLGAVIPDGCARFSRGFLALAEIYLRGAPPEAVRAAPTWGTVETVRVLPGSDDLLVPAMTALRDVGPLGAAGVRALQEAEHPWRIERLHLAASPALLASTARLPELRHLVVAGEHAAILEARAREPWWSRLERVTLTGTVDAVTGFVSEGPTWLRRLAPLRELAVVTTDDRGEPAGWQWGFAGDAVHVECVGYHAGASLDLLVALVGTLPPGAELVLASSRFHVFTSADLARLASSTGRALRHAT